MFWAGRIDKVCCSRKCINNFNTIKLRNDPEKRAQINEQRRKNREQKKKLKAKREEREFKETLK